MRKKNTQESEDERWARLDKRIERVSARHELARLGMGTIFQVKLIIIGERAKLVKHSQVCSIENRDIYVCVIVTFAL